MQADKNANQQHEQTVQPITHILVADRSPVVRVGMRAVIEERPTWKVAAEAEDGSEAIVGAVETRPYIAILGLRLPVMDGVAVTSKLRELVPETEVMIFAVEIDGTLIAGARGYVSHQMARID